MYFNSDPAVSEADLHVLSGAMAFGGADTLGAGAFWAISRSVLEAAGLERDEDERPEEEEEEQEQEQQQQQQQEQEARTRTRTARRTSLLYLSSAG